MRTQLALQAARQHGVFTRAQARDAGYRGPEIRQLTSPDGAWIVLRRGVYMDRDRWNSLGQHREQPLAIARAAHLAMDVEHVLSHDSAAYAWGIPLLRPARPIVHVTRPGVVGSRTEHGIKHHLARTLEDPCDVLGLPVTGLARTALDIAREHGRLPGLVACDGALRYGASRAEFDEVIASMRSWRHITRVRAAARAAVLGAESPGETLARDLAIEAGLGTPMTQFPIEVSAGTAWCDLLVGSHVIEFDGRRKYVPTNSGGLAADPHEVLWHEKVRERDIASHGLGISRVVWDDCFGTARQRTLTYLAEQHQAFERRFGRTPPPEVTAYAERFTAARRARLEREFRPVSRIRSMPWSA